MSLRIGLLSDTHSYWDDKFVQYFSECDEIWHAGDIGDASIAQRLAQIKPLRAVYGNIDGRDVRYDYPEHLRFKCENVDVWMTHIGGYPGKYSPKVKAEMLTNPPKLFVCGHSHILRVMFDKKLGVLCVNPGAAGRFGIQSVRTLIRFTIDGDVVRDLEVVELGDSYSM